MPLHVGEQPAVQHLRYTFAANLRVGGFLLDQDAPPTFKSGSFGSGAATRERVKDEVAGMRQEPNKAARQFNRELCRMPVVRPYRWYLPNTSAPPRRPLVLREALAFPAALAGYVCINVVAGFKQRFEYPPLVNRWGGGALMHCCPVTSHTIEPEVRINIGVTKSRSVTSRRYEPDDAAESRRVSGSTVNEQVLKLINRFN